MDLAQLETRLYLIFDNYATNYARRHTRKAIQEYFAGIMSEQRARIALDITFAHTDTNDVECIMSIVDYLTRFHNADNHN